MLRTKFTTAESAADQRPEGAGMDIQAFNFGEAAVRVVMIDGEPWFVLKDVCDVLGISNPSNVAKRLDDDEKSTLHLMEGGVGNTIISESGLYSVLLRSDKPQAKPFRKWVTSEVLPSIRKTGSYQLAAPAPELPSYPEALRQLADTLEAKARAEAQLALAAPKVEAFDALMDSRDNMLMREAGKILGVGQNRLYAFLREHEVIIPHTCEPYQRHVDAGRFVVNVTTYTRNDTQFSAKITRVTPKGLEYIRQLLSKAGGVA